MTTLCLSEDDLHPQQTWQLAAWCIARGADEFGVTLMGLQGFPEPFNDRFLAAIEPHRLPQAARPHVTTYVDQDVIRPAQLWRASVELLTDIRTFFHDGLFTYMTSAHEEGWLENPTIYRDGEIMLGVVSHEGEGYLQLTTPEAAQVAAMGIPTRVTGTFRGAYEG
jgi:hypothetical protein